MKDHKIVAALALALMSGHAPYAAAESARSRVTTIKLPGGVPAWAKENGAYVDELCASPPGAEHAYALSNYSVVVSNDEHAVAAARSPNPPRDPTWIVSCADKTAERVPPVSDLEKEPSPNAEALPADYLQWLRDNEAYLQGLCATAAEPGAQHAEAFGYGIVVSFDRERVLKALERQMRVINCPRSGQTVEAANRPSVEAIRSGSAESEETQP